MRLPALALVLLFAALPCNGQDVIDGFAARVYRNGRQSMSYRLFIPPGYKQEMPYPLVLWLHGAGGAGSDNRQQILADQTLGTRTWTKPQNQAKHPTFVLVPQSPTNWVTSGLDRLSPEMAMVLSIIDSIRAEFNIDAARMYVAGQSDGGIGTWNVILQRPNLFAAAVPLCGGGDPTKVSAIASLPLWAFHGGRDKVIPVAESRKMISALRRAGGHPRYTEYSSVGHDVWIRAFAEPELVDWLFAQHK
jgi:predicted peptidase